MLQRMVQWLQLPLISWGPEKKPESTQARPGAAELQAVWVTLIREYFPTRQDLETYTLRWSSRRQRRVLASCHLGRRIVNVAQELRYPELRQWLSPLLYHELCHAVLGKEVDRRGRRRAWHGRKFKDLEQRHPQIPALNEWIQAGGWRKAVRSHRSRSVHSKRRPRAFD